MKFEQLISLFQETHKELQAKATHSVDIALVVRNWLFGWYIVEYEQRGEDRAKYGSYLIDELSKELTVKGTSPTNLRKFREFYQAYPDIQQTVSVRSIYSEKGDAFSFAIKG
ncbi:MAG: DUF1016 N-terminal domain-containing protein [Candidatus Aminicenantes bacterium]|nr:DUF1016 N-terminal domain-containing protein [Candidatus Aminicenantes bacterium]